MKSLSMRMMSGSNSLGRNRKFLPWVADCFSFDHNHNVSFCYFYFRLFVIQYLLFLKVVIITNKSNTMHMFWILMHATRYPAFSQNLRPLRKKEAEYSSRRVFAFIHCLFHFSAACYLVVLAMGVLNVILLLFYI